MNKAIRIYPTVWPYWLAITLGRLVCWATSRHKRVKLLYPLAPNRTYWAFCARCRKFLFGIQLHTETRDCGAALW